MSKTFYEFKTEAEQKGVDLDDNEIRKLYGVYRSGVVNIISMYLNDPEDTMSMCARLLLDISEGVYDKSEASRDLKEELDKLENKQKWKEVINQDLVARCLVLYHAHGHIVTEMSEVVYELILLNRNSDYDKRLYKHFAEVKERDGIVPFKILTDNDNKSLFVLIYDLGIVDKMKISYL